MILVLTNGEWVEGEPYQGDRVREMKGGGSYVEYTYITPSEPAPDMRITKLAFKTRMTADERIAIRAAAETDAIIYDFLDLVSDAQFIDLSRNDTINGVNYLESQGHLDVGRATEILTNPIEQDERP